MAKTDLWGSSDMASEQSAGRSTAGGFKDYSHMMQQVHPNLNTLAPMYYI
jgi:hypothetical protein